ncbi:MAG: hypothetical protein FWD87_03855 [Spirochaetaceae bacterium]|nr:hypothetical protein [Spirochaetaceae bacterium]
MYEIIEKIIKVLVVKRENPVINFTFFSDQLASYFESNREHVEAKNLEEFINSAIPAIKRMEAEEVCTIDYDGPNIRSFQVHKYYRQLVMKHYKIIEERPECAFPDQKTFSFSIHNDWLISYNAQQNFMEAPELVNNDRGKILAITFGEGVSSIIIPPEIVNTTLFDIVLKKVHLYVQNQNNFAYLGRYLNKAFEKSEGAVKTMMQSMLSGPPGFREHIRKPEDFSFKFFSYLSNKVIKDLSGKSEKTAPDIANYQAMALLRAFTTYGRASSQKDAQKISDMKDLSFKVKKPPYIFSTAEMFELKDNVGTPYSKKYSNEFVTEFINKATTRKEKEDLPSLVKVSADPKKEYYIARDMVPQVFLKTLVESSKEIKDKYFKEWEQLLRKYKTNRDMQNDITFNESLNVLLKSDYKLLNALLNPDLIYLANRLSTANKNIKMSVDSCFSEPGKFRSLDKLLNIDREDFIKEIRATLPLHYSVPFFGRLISLFISMLFKKNGGKKAESGDISNQDKRTNVDGEEVFQEFGSALNENENSKKAASVKADKNQDFLSSISNLRNKYLSPGKDLEQTLEELIEKWNFMVDKTARKNLTLDINSLIKGFLRSRKRVLVRYKTLNEKRISELTDDLLIQMTNLGIKNKDAFRVYIELYMLKLLGNMRTL